VQGRGNGLPGTAGDESGWPGMGEDGWGLWGRPGTERVMSHDTTIIHSEIYDINSGQYRREIIG